MEIVDSDVADEQRGSVTRIQDAGLVDKGRRVSFDPGAVFAFDIALAVDRVVGESVFGQRPDVAQPERCLPAQVNVSLDHERMLGSGGQFRFERINAGDRRQQRNGQECRAEKVFRIHQNFRLRLIYGMGQAKTESM